MRKLFCIVTACIIILSIFSGCSVLEKLGLRDSENDELRPVSSIVLNEDEARELADKMPVRLYFANEDNSKLLTEIRYIPMSEAKKSVNNLASVIVKELIKGPMENTGMKPTIPEGTKLRSPVNINAGIAVVDLTREFVDKHPGGKDAEQMSIYSIVNSLTELKEIQKVKFAVDGKERKDFKGGFKFDEPFPRSQSLISKDPPVRSTTVAPDEKKDENKDDSPTFDGQDIIEDGINNAQDSFGEFDEGSEETYIEIFE
jgi:germination protein M